MTRILLILAAGACLGVGFCLCWLADGIGDSHKIAMAFTAMIGIMGSLISCGAIIMHLTSNWEELGGPR